MKHYIANIIAVVLLVTSFAVSAVAGPLEDGEAAFGSRDYATALRLWQPLANQGNASAQSRLGWMYTKGLGVRRSHAEAMKWYRKAAEQGQADAQYNLGIMYQHGRGGPKDYAEAAKLYQLAAEQGLAEAQTNLGIMYMDGLGVAQDYVGAYMWFSLAASQGYEGAARKRADAARSMTSDQIAEAQRLAREWKPNSRAGLSAE